MSSPPDTEYVVIGAGIVGLAVARALAERGAEVVLLEQETAIGTHTSSRNSEVIHAGIYYPPGSNKARFCVQGRDMLYEYAAARGIEHRRTGKIILCPTEAETKRLATYAERADDNGVHDLHPMSGGEVAALEPTVRCHSGLFSPSTGQIDSHGLMLSLLGDLERAGGLLSLTTEARRITPHDDGFSIDFVSAGEPGAISCRRVINSGGLFAVDVAHRIEGLADKTIPTAHYGKGSYFRLPGAPPVRHLIYPLPQGGSLGLHLTPFEDAPVRFGPDIEWIDAPDYTVDPARAAYFAESIRPWFPDVDAGELQPDFAGVRPKIVGPGEPNSDFRLDGEAVHGIPGLVNLFGIESPGLTSSLAIGEAVAAMF